MSNVVHRSIRKASLPRTGRELDAMPGGVDGKGNSVGSAGTSFAGYWSLITTDKDNNPLEEAAQYIKTKYTAVSEGDVVAYVASDHDIILPHAGYNMIGAVQIKPDSGLIIDSATGLLSVDPSWKGNSGGVDFTVGSGLQLSAQKILSIKYGVAADTVAAGNDSRILNGQKAFEVISKGTWWGQKMTDAGVVTGAMTGVTNINGKLTFASTGVDVTDNIRATGDVVAYATAPGDISDWLGLVIDNDTIRFNTAGKLYAAGGGQAGIAGITVSGSGNAITSVALSADKTSLTFTKGSTFALKSEIPIIPSSLKNPYSLSWSGYSSGSYDGSSSKSFSIPSNTNQLTNGAGFITGINQSMILSALTGCGNSSKYLAGNGTFYTIAYSELSGTPDLSVYVTLSGQQTISGYKHFISGLSSGNKSGSWIDISANNYINGMSGSSLYNLYLNYVSSSKFVRIDNSCNITATGDVVAYSAGSSGTSLSISWSEIIGKPSGLVTSVSITGSGNAVTGASFSGGQLSLSKGTVSGGGGSSVSWGTDTGNTVDLSVNGTSKKLTLAGGFSVTGTSSSYRTVVIAGNTNNYSLYGHAHTWGEITSKPSGLVTSVSFSGSGNAIVSASFSSNTLYLTRGTISGGSSSVSWSSVTGKPSGLVTSVSISGSGNALTGASFSGGTLYLSKGTISGGGSWNGGSVSNSISCPNLWINTSSSGYRLAVNGASTYTGKAEFGNTVQITGSCWIGTTQSSYKCAIVGNGVITGTWQQNSDIRLKNRLYDITGILPRLSGIDVFAFTMKSGDATRRLGVSAQQIQSVFPELIGCDIATEEKYLSVDYSTLGAIVAIQGCKELYTEIRTLKNRIKELENQLNINTA